jgi:hypothetical protein
VLLSQEVLGSRECSHLGCRCVERTVAAERLLLLQTRRYNVQRCVGLCSIGASVAGALMWNATGRSRR